MHFIKGIELMVVLLPYWISDAKPASKYVINWRKFESCPNYNNVNLDITRLKLNQVDEYTVKLQGSFDINKDIEHGPFTSKAYLEKELLGGAFMHVMQVEGGDMCDSLTEENQIWSPYFRNLQPQPPAKCPLTKGTFDTSLVNADTSGVDLTRELVGKYRVTLELFVPSNSTPGTIEKFSCFVVRIAVDKVQS